MFLIHEKMFENKDEFKQVHFFSWLSSFISNESLNLQEQDKILLRKFTNYFDKDFKGDNDIALILYSYLKGLESKEIKYQPNLFENILKESVGFYLLKQIDEKQENLKSRTSNIRKEVITSYKRKESFALFELKQYKNRKDSFNEFDFKTYESYCKSIHAIQKSYVNLLYFETNDNRITDMYFYLLDNQETLFNELSKLYNKELSPFLFKLNKEFYLQEVEQTNQTLNSLF